MLADAPVKFATPKVSVAMITYNHEKFIAQAIESVLMQKTPFSIELIIGEDCSTDGTRKIVQRYAASYPTIIRPLLPPANLGPGRNVAAVMETCRGNYFALLEGDDYWTDPNKLTLQVEFMESHPECAICHHRVEAIEDRTGSRSYEYPPVEWRKERIESDALLQTNFIQTCSALYRKEMFPKNTDSFSHLKVLDWALAILASRQGGIGYIDRLMAVYRLHEGSDWQAKSYEFRCFHTLEMFSAVEIALGADEPSTTAEALDATIVGLAKGCKPRIGTHYSRKVAWFCLKRALHSRMSRNGLVKQAARLGLPRF